MKSKTLPFCVSCWHHAAKFEKLVVERENEKVAVFSAKLLYQAKYGFLPERVGPVKAFKNGSWEFISVH